MADHSLGLVSGHFLSLYGTGTVSGLTDAELLQRFARRRDAGGELAFAALVERHGPMVLRACRGILRDNHEAMDAFQATFLVLARKGSSLWVSDSVGPWLHRVACRAAGRARITSIRRRVVETEAAEVASAFSKRDDDALELEAIIHQEIDRLPERYRLAVVLCDLEDLSCEEAAGQLGCPIGTLASRLARGRQRLRDRLRRQGLAPSTRPTPEPSRLAMLPAGLATSTARSAVQFFTTRTVLQGTAVTLSMEVLRAMSVNHAWKIGSLLLAMSASTVGVVGIAGRDALVVGADQPPAGAAPKKTVFLKTEMLVEKASVEKPPEKVDEDGFVEIQPGKLERFSSHTTLLQSSDRTDVSSNLDEDGQIASILPEGTTVKKGDLVCELNSGKLVALRQSSQNQLEKAVELAKATTTAREIAEISLAEYQEGIFPQELRLALNEVEEAEALFHKTLERLKRTQKAKDQIGGILNSGRPSTSSDILAELDVSDRLDAATQEVTRCKANVDVVKSKRLTLEKFTRAKTLKGLSLEVEKAQTADLVAKREIDRLKSRLEKLDGQIKNCKLLAPTDGTISFASSVFRSSLTENRSIKGVGVPPGLTILSVIDPQSTVLAVASVAKSIVDGVKPGSTATITIHAYAGMTFPGIVESITPEIDEDSFPTGSHKLKIKFEKAPPGVREGMKAGVRMSVDDLENVLSVPNTAVFAVQGQNTIKVKRPDGGTEFRIVTLGRSNGERTEVLQGLKAGEKISVKP